MKELTEQEALSKTMRYCSIQERCNLEVRIKLSQLGCSTQIIEKILSVLQEMNFLNESRFSEAFVRGKFLIKGWGRIKIVAALKLKKITQMDIDNGLNQIDPLDYMKKLKVLASKKKINLVNNKGLTELEIKQRTVNYLAHKGYEYEFIYKVIKI